MTTGNPQGTPITEVWRFLVVYYIIGSGREILSPVRRFEGSITSNGSTSSKQRATTEKENEKGILLPYMQPKTTLLLDVSMRFSDML